MSLTTEEFITRFQSLPGNTVGEKQRHLRELLQTLSNNDKSNLDISKLLPRTPLEEKLKIDALIYLKRLHDLLNLLRSDNPAIIKRIFKLGDWFFQSFANVTREELVNELFPFVSHNVKMKLVNKLAIHLGNAEQADSIFNAIKDKYGSNLALKLLPACTLETILHHIELGEKLPPSQLLSVIKKHPEQKTKFLKGLAKYKMEKQCNHVLKYLMLNHVDAFIQLHLEHNFSHKLGKRLTQKFISNHKESVIAAPNTYFKILHNKQIPKSLQKDFSRCFANLYPNKVEDYQASRRLIVSKLKILPSKINAVDLYLSTFREVYGCEIWDHPTYVTIHLLKMLNSPERESRLISIYKQQISEDEWMSLHKTEISIPYFLKRISLTSDIDSRRELIKLLVDTCKINGDPNGLGKVCNYMLSRHRNDNIRVRVAFLKQIQDNFLLENLEEVHWSCINDFLQIFSMNQESYYEEDTLMEGYIHYRLKNNLPVVDQLKDWITSGKYNLNLIKQNSSFEKTCLVAFGQIISEGSYKDKYIPFLTALLNWNKRHKNNQISLFTYPNCLEHFKAEVERKVWINSADSIASYLLDHADLEQKSEYLNLYLRIGNRFCDLKQIDKYLRNYPLIAVTYMEKIAGLILEMNDKFTIIFLRRCQYLHHLNVPQTVIKIALEVLQEKSDEYSHRWKVQRTMLALSSLVSVSEFSKFAYPYQPEGSQADTNKDKFTMQKLICNNLKNLRPITDGLPLIVKFCKGDYLKFIRPSLYSMCGYTTEDKLKTVLTDLSNLSAHKHVLHIAFRNMDLNFINNVIKQMKENTKTSIRRLVFKVVFNMFVRDPSDYNWSLVKSSVETLDVNDKESFGLFLNIQKIPNNYLTAYQMFAWDVLSKLSNTEREIDLKRSRLLNSIDAEGSQALPPSFVDTIIKNCFFKSYDFDEFQNSVQILTCKYVIHCKDKSKQAERLKSIFSILKYYTDSKWANPEYRSKVRNVCSKFLHNFCSGYLEKNNLDRTILQVFYEMWNDFRQPQESFADYLYLRFTLMYSSLDSSEKFLKEFIELCNNLTLIYGLIIIEFISSIFEQIYTHYLNRDGENSRYTFIEDLVNAQQSDVCSLIAISLIGNNEPYDSDIKKRHELLMETLKKTESVTIQLYLNRHIRGKTTLEYH